MKKIALLFINLLIINFLNAQNIQQGLTMSQDMVSGSARYVGMAGAFNSLGGDFSSIINNPAGLGVYRSSELGFSLNFSKVGNESNYFNNNVYTLDRKFDFDHIGFVSSLSANNTDKSGFQFYNFGFGYNKLADYNGVSVVRGVNPNSSITDYFAANANGINYNMLSYEYDGDNLVYDPFFDSNLPFESILAWNTFMIDTIPSLVSDYISPLFVGDQVLQERTLTTNGDKGEYNFSFATNYNDVLFIGASFGLQRLEYAEFSKYNEYYVVGNLSDFDELNYDQTMDISGTGMNAKFGIIYKPIKSLRFGASIHSPTFYTINSFYRISMSSYFITDNYFSSIEGNIKYNYETPMKTILGASYILNNIGLLSIDYELIDYRTLRYSNGTGGDTFEDMNTMIRDNYTIAHNLRIGAEAKLGNMALRGGFASYSTPYNKNTDQLTSGILQYSGGIGYNFGSVKFDIAYTLRTSSETNRFYNLGDTPTYNIDSNYSKLIFTLGLRF